MHGSTSQSQVPVAWETGYGSSRSPGQCATPLATHTPATSWARCEGMLRRHAATKRGSFAVGVIILNRRLHMFHKLPHPPNDSDWKCSLSTSSMQPLFPDLMLVVRRPLT